MPPLPTTYFALRPCAHKCTLIKSAINKWYLLLMSIKLCRRVFRRRRIIFGAPIYIYRCIRLCCGDASSATLATMANRAPHPHVWESLLNDVLCRCVFYSIVSSNMCSIRTMRTWHTFRKSAKNRGTIGSRAMHKHAMREWTHTRTTQHTRDVKRWHRRWWWFIWHIR